MVNWKTVCRPKKLGGLGIAELHRFGRALHLSWPWLQWTDPGPEPKWEQQRALSCPLFLFDANLNICESTNFGSAPCLLKCASSAPNGTTESNTFLSTLIYYLFILNAGGNYGYNRGPAPTHAIRTSRSQPIEVPAISLDEIKEITKNFSSDALIGEGSYARVFLGVLKDGKKSAVKRLDSSKQPDQEFLVQVQGLFPSKIISLHVGAPYGLPFDFHFFCRSRLFQDSSMTMSSNFSGTVL